MLIVLRWLQPFPQIIAHHLATATADRLGCIMERNVMAALNIFKNWAWEVWLNVLRLTIVTIAIFMYSEDRPRRRRPSKWWKLGIKTINDMSTAIGNWIENAARPNPRCKRRQRIIATTMRHRQTTQLLAMTVLAMQAKATISTEREVRFDTDSAQVGIDNRCSACISHVKSDFEGPLRKSDRVIKQGLWRHTHNKRSNWHSQVELGG